jgi:hypothetical protein
LGADSRTVLAPTVTAAGVELRILSFATAALFLDAFPTIGLDQSSADLAAEIRRVHRLRLPDAFQAAVARMRGLKLATRNTKDFPQGRFPFVVVPYSIP